MPNRRVLPPSGAPAPIDFQAVRSRLGIPSDYPADAVAEARAAAGAPPVPATDRTDLPLVTIDPVGSMDLDQAMHLEARADGYRVHYAIADVASFVDPDGALAKETWRRGETLYSPDLATPLHPRELSEGAASLLPDQKRPAVLWTIDLGPDGEPVAVDLGRALVRSVARLDYVGVQRDLDAGTLHPSIRLLPEIGRLREQASRARHAITLDLPDAEVVHDPDGHWTLDLRVQSEIERANAHISLLTGMCAAQIMLAGRIGLLRTLPPAGEKEVRLLRSSAAALHIDWPAGTPAGDLIAGLDASSPAVAAFLDDAVHLLRGAGYTPFDGTVPDQPLHAGVGAPYAHVTAPLRRLVDRFATEICLALHAEQPVPQWVSSSMTELPKVMTTSGRLAAELDRGCTAAVTDFLLAGREGDEFAATVLQVDVAKDRAVVLLHEPPVRAHCAAAGLREGAIGQVRLVSVDQDTGGILVTPIDSPPDVPGATGTPVAG